MEMSLICTKISNPFSFEWFRTNTRFETKAEQQLGNVLFLICTFGILNYNKPYWGIALCSSYTGSLVQDGRPN